MSELGVNFVNSFRLGAGFVDFIFSLPGLAFELINTIPEPLRSIFLVFITFIMFVIWLKLWQKILQATIGAIL